MPGWSTILDSPSPKCDPEFFVYALPSVETNKKKQFILPREKDSEIFHDQHQRPSSNWGSNSMTSDRTSHFQVMNPILRTLELTIRNAQCMVYLPTFTP